MTTKEEFYKIKKDLQRISVSFTEEEQYFIIDITYDYGYDYTVLVPYGLNQEEMKLYLKQYNTLYNLKIEFNRFHRYIREKEEELDTIDKDEDLSDIGKQKKMTPCSNHLESYREKFDEIHAKMRKIIGSSILLTEDENLKEQIKYLDEQIKSIMENFDPVAYYYSQVEKKKKELTERRNSYWNGIDNFIDCLNKNVSYIPFSLRQSIKLSIPFQ
jgi:hypothetical protein